MMRDLIYSPYMNFETVHQSKKMPITAFITLSAAMVAGTGGILVTSNASLQNAFGAQPFIRGVDWERRRSEEEKYAHTDLISKVRAAFGMNYTQLAYTLNVSRQAVHDWVKGSQPRTEVLTRLWHMEALGRSLDGLSAPRKRSLLLRPIMEGKNLLTLLREDADVRSSIQTLLENSLMIESISCNANPGQTRLKKVRRVSIEDISRVLS
jgi:hypothetical protein